ncbi:hypothetical protein B0A55_04220 [Friedmanniomyces simplex]|uniref:Pali-domain-containing protein n=1 Tax=Friedmanniomyces simplex TaxID=329884 RepID=A0A4U0XSK5_9PEZI|nr:hypothetical protein B0A55_04220 [Friedmanniomyces simplex]
MALYSVAKRTHWFGVALLFISAILLLVTTISAPIIGDISLLRVTLTNKTDIRNSSVSFGSFGYCVLDVPPITTDQDWCGSRHIGYNPADIMARIDHIPFSEMAAGTSDSLTRVMILHPIACALAFIAFLCSLGSGIIGSLVGAFVAFAAWILVLVSIAVDFSLFGIIKHHVNNDKSGSVAKFGPGIWVLLAAFVTLFLGMLTVFFTCCTAQREKKRAGTAGKNEGYPPNTDHGVAAAPRRKKFGLF